MQIEPPCLKKRELSLQWLNGLVHIHDFICKCNKPLEHTLDTIITEEPNLRLPETTKEKLKKCLGGTKEDTPGEDDVGVGEGDLDALFAEDFIDDTG